MKNLILFILLLSTPGKAECIKDITSKCMEYIDIFNDEYKLNNTKCVTKALSICFDIELIEIIKDKKTSLKKKKELLRKYKMRNISPLHDYYFINERKIIND